MQPFFEKRIIAWRNQESAKPLRHQLLLSWIFNSENFEKVGRRGNARPADSGTELATPQIGWWSLTMVVLSSLMLARFNQRGWAQVRPFLSYFLRVPIDVNAPQSLRYASTTISNSDPWRRRGTLVTHQGQYPILPDRTQSSLRNAVLLSSS